MSKTQFTIKINPTGYSDQLNQFMLIYELGLRLGLKYVYTDIADTYGRFNENTPKFIDLIFENSKTYNEQLVSCEVPINSTEMLQQGVTSGDEMIAFINAAVKATNTQENSLIVLKLAGNRNRLFEWLADFKDDITAPLRKAMNQQMKACNHNNLYPFDAAIKVFIHLRLGDVTRLATPWPYDFNLWHSTDMGALAVNTPESMRLLRVCIRELTEIYGEDQICFSIHSDNFDLAQRDYADLMQESSIVNKEQQSICRHLLAEMSCELALFQQFKNAHVFIDPDPLGIEKLTTALLESDLAITNGSQRMIAKLLGIFSIDKPIALSCLMENSKDKVFHTGMLPTNSMSFIPLEYQRFSLKPLRHFIDQQVVKTQVPWCYPETLNNRDERSVYCPVDLYQAGCELQSAQHHEDALDCFRLSQELCNANDDAVFKQIEVLQQLGRIDEVNTLKQYLHKKANDTLIAAQNYISTKFNMGEKAALSKLVDAFGDDLLKTAKNKKIEDFIALQKH